MQNTLIETHFTKYSRQLYEKLHKEGHDIGLLRRKNLGIVIIVFFINRFY